MVPDNGKFLLPPKLNIEVEVALPVKRSERDYRIADHQASVSSALAGLDRALTTLMRSNKPKNAPLISNLSSVLLILLNAFSRRYWYVSCVDFEQSEFHNAGAITQNVSR